MLTARAAACALLKPWLRLAQPGKPACPAPLAASRHVKCASRCSSAGGELAEQRCVPCESDGGGLAFMGLCEALSRGEAEAAAAALEPAWEVVESGGEGGGLALQAQYRCRSFLSALELCDRIAAVAEAEGHHPDLHVTGWNRLRVVLSTHARRGVTQNDLILAAKVNRLEKEDLLRKKKGKPKFEDV